MGLKGHSGWPESRKHPGCLMETKREAFLSDPPTLHTAHLVPLSALTDCKAPLPQSPPVAAWRSSRELAGTMCLSARMCSCLSMLLAWAQPRWWQAALLHLVCFGSYLSRPICYFYSLSLSACQRGFPQWQVCGNSP